MRSAKKADVPSLSRRAMLGNMGAMAAAFAGSGKAVAANAARPNILWIVSEDNNPYVGAYGDKLAHTPTIDGLAAKGLLFRHVYSNAPVCAPSRFGILTGIYPESCAPANQMRAVGKLPKEFRTYPELLRENGYFCTNNSKTDYNCDVDPKAIWDIQGAEGHWRKRPSNKPFMAVFNYETTHESRILKPTTGRVTPDMIRVPAFLPDLPGIRQDYASYYNLMEKMDGQLAERLAQLEVDGLADDTIIFHYSDNGGVLPRSKRYCYEEGLRCEMVVYVPPKWQALMPAQPGSEITTPVSFIDLAPTVLSLAGIRQPAQMNGTPFLGRQSFKKQTFAFGMRNRMDERVDFSRTVTDGRWRYIRNYMPHRPWGQHQAFEWLAKGYQEWEAAHLAGSLTPVQDRFFQTKPFEELYDLDADPDEVRNLAAERANARMLERLRKALDAHMISINDNGFLPEGMAGEGYVESRDRKLYPLTDVMSLAALAAKGEADALPHLISALSHPSDVMRYWGATGILIRGSGAESARGAIEQSMRADTSPYVRLVLAEALARLGTATEAVETLIGLAGGETSSWQVQLHAMNALCFVGEMARPALPVAKKLSVGDQEYLRSLGRFLIAKLDGSYTPASPIFDYEHMMEMVRKGKFG